MRRAHRASVNSSGMVGTRSLSSGARSRDPLACPPYKFSQTISQVNPFPLRLILPDDGEGKCAVQHSVSVSQ